MAKNGKNGKNGKYSRLIACGLALALLLGNYGNVYAASGTWQNGRRDRSEISGAESSAPAEREELTESEEPAESEESIERAEQGEPTDSAVPESPAQFDSDFKDDSGSNTQYADGWIYGYWSRQLCRVNVETLEAEVLFETASPQAGIFSLYGGMIYFIEQRGVSDPEGGKANLWRMKYDGSGRELIVEKFDMPEYIETCMEIYDDILYLLSGWDEKNDRYFRLKKDGSAEQITREETLYGMVPEGWQDAWRLWYSGLRDIVYCVRNFGYAFLCDESGDLYRSDLKTGEMERVTLQNADSARNVILTDDRLVYRDKGGDLWYSVSLEDLEDVTQIGEMNCSEYDIAFWDEKGIYSIDRSYWGSGFSIVRLNWSGERETLDYWVQNPRLHDSVYGDYLTVLYSDGTYLYYDNLSGGDGVICRRPLEGDEAEAVPVFVYYDNPTMEISTRETFSTTFTVEETGHSGEFSMTRVYLTEDTEAAARINAVLEEIYLSEEEYMAELRDDVRAAALSDWEYEWDMTLVEDELSASIRYLDDSYIGISFFWYEYWNGAAHGQHGNVEYVFSRLTGEQVLLTDIVENSEEEICAIIAPYVEAEADWGTDEEGWEWSILEEGRFYLAMEGIGIHYDAYELSSYASGGIDVVVPYELFDMRDPEDVGLTSF
ncbi:MAG: RsiV family protein [Firmicutes bacterium]|nr:RsiV family protein [Bacillota bacterium]